MKYRKTTRNKSMSKKRIFTVSSNVRGYEMIKTIKLIKMKKCRKKNMRMNWSGNERNSKRLSPIWRMMWIKLSKSKRKNLIQMRKARCLGQFQLGLTSWEIYWKFKVSKTVWERSVLFSIKSTREKIKQKTLQWLSKNWKSESHPITRTSLNKRGWARLTNLIVALPRSMMTKT